MSRKAWGWGLNVVLTVVLWSGGALATDIPPEDGCKCRAAGAHSSAGGADASQLGVVVLAGALALGLRRSRFRA